MEKPAETEITPEAISLRLTSFFGDILNQMEEKFIKDYEELRSYSIEYTDLYHIYYDELVPMIPVKAEPVKTQDRSKTPIKQNKSVLKTEKPSATARNPGASPKKDLSSTFTKDRSKTPVIDRTKTVAPDRSKTPSIMTTSQKIKECIRKELIKPIDQVEVVNNTNITTLKTTTQTKVSTKTVKRDMTPTPVPKKKEEMVNTKENLNTSNISKKEKDKEPKKKPEKEPKKSIVEKKDSLTIKIEEPKVEEKQQIQSEIPQISTSGQVKEEEVKREELEKNAANEINLNNNNKPLENEKIAMETEKKVTLKVKRIYDDSDLYSNNLKCLYLVSNNQVTPKKMRYIITTSFKEIFEKNNGVKNIISTLKDHKPSENEINAEKNITSESKDGKDQLEQKLKELENSKEGLLLIDPQVQMLVEKQFVASKTAVSGLNFLTPDEEKKLKSKEQPEEILNIFRFIYIALNCSYDDLPPQELIPNLSQIYTEKGVDSLKSLLLNYMTSNMNLTEEQVTKMAKLIGDNPKIFSSGDLTKLNRAVSFMSYILKEMYEYASNKFDGVLILSLRLLKKQIDEIKSSISKF